MAEHATSTGQARLVAEAVGRPADLLVEGGESRTFGLRGSDLIVSVPLGWPDDRLPVADLDRRAVLLERVADRVGVPVPRVERTVPDAGLMVVRRLAGERLIDVPPADLRRATDQVAQVVGRVLAALHTSPPAAYDGLVPVDDDPPAEWLEEAAALARDLAGALDAEQQRDVRAFLAAPPPEPAPELVLSHDDLGIEHVLVDRATGAVTGIIDWDDAARCDPAHDFGLLLRDLGPEALETALAAYVEAGVSADGIPERAVFHARCKLLEDLAFGLERGRPEYVRKSTAAWDRLFRAR